MSMLTPFIKHCTENSSQSNKARKRKKRKKKAYRQKIFTYEIIEHIEIYKESTKKPIRISEFSKAAGYKSYEKYKNI